MDLKEINDLINKFKRDGYTLTTHKHQEGMTVQIKYNERLSIHLMITPGIAEKMHETKLNDFLNEYIDKFDFSLRKNNEK